MLGASVVGVYLYGSAVEGGLRPGSDLDVFVVTSRPTTPAERRQLVDALIPISRRGRRAAGWRPVELTVVAHADVRPWRFPPRVGFQYGEWLADAFDAGAVEPSAASHPDLAVIITMLLRRSEPLFGPPAVDVLDPVPHADLLGAMLDGIEPLLADLESDTANVLLTIARIWVTVATGDIRAKDGAAEWALSRVPTHHRPALELARAVYLGSADDIWDGLEADARRHAAYVIGEIQREARGAGL